jgi:DNA-binding PadR family transcriptional regulator
MSLRHALLNLLAGEPRSGYDLSRVFSVSMGNVWPAQHSQIYPELAKLLADGLIRQTGEGPRGRRVYQTTPEGVGELRSWLRDAEPDYSIRHPAQLRAFCMWALPTGEALALLDRDRAEYVRHLGEIDHALADVDWSASPQQRASRLVIEFGRRYYTLLIEWTDWAAEQVAAGALQPGNPPPGVPSAAPVTVIPQNRTAKSSRP